MFPLVQISRITRLGYPLLKASTQKSFLALLLLTAAFRTVFFIAVPLIAPQPFYITHFKNPFYTVLDDLGCIVFYILFTYLILFWAEIIYHAQNRRAFFTRRMRPTYYALQVIIFIGQAAIWVYLLIQRDDHVRIDQVDVIDNIYYSAISLIASFGFLYYGGQLYIMLKRNPIESGGRTTKLREVFIVTTVCTVCFVARSVLVILITFMNFDVNFIVVAVYYFISEVVPSFMVMYVLRKLPPPPISSVPSSYRGQLPSSYAYDDRHPLVPNTATPTSSPHKPSTPYGSLN
eukprot:TRINITY_DN4612_c0_g1_i6.p1 TRINITY_DN4612_c0_g1~~TRINITY_DN4612_c0_g1_i6.p1  ORF type:complete len:321 (-),score=92.62 TRINITY_DN4612_c0_g1_i6:27-896(-)